MIKPKSDLVSIKKTIAEYFRRQVDVTVNLGRNKVLRYCGELSGVYPALFTVRPNDKNFLGKTSYSYAEVLCGSVKVKPKEAGESNFFRAALPFGEKRRESFIHLYYITPIFLSRGVCHVFTILSEFF